MAIKLLPLALLLTCACSGTTAAETADGWAIYGQGVGEDQPVTLAKVLDDPAAWDGEPLLIEATIDECCLVKGCWMTFTEGDETVRVTFKDYAFFVPLDSAGRRARVEGTFRIREVPVDEARHYLEDAGRLAEAAAITEPQRGYEIVAAGVEIQTAR